MFGLITLFIIGVLITGFVLVLQSRGKVADLTLLTARLRKEVDSMQERLYVLERQQAAPAAAPLAESAARAPEQEQAPVSMPVPVLVPVPAPVPVPVPPAATTVPAELAKAAPAAASLSVPAPRPTQQQAAAKPAPAAASTPSWIAQPDGLVAKARNWLFTGNLVAKLGLLILFLGVSFLLKYVAAQVTVPIELRLAGIALADIALLAWAWRIRSSRPGISLPLQGTALAILMLVTFGAFRLYELIPAGLAFGLLFVLTVFTCLLAVLQNAVWLAVFGIVGGFAVPLLISTGSGNHIGLFSYYALLNAGVFGIALKRAWRVLNVLSFGFTFAVATTWGLLRYTPDNYLSSQLFLILFVLFYVGIAIAYCARQAPRLKHYVDGTLVFGTPLAAMGLQYGLVRQFEFGLPFSALVAGLCYTGLAVALWRRHGFRLLAEAFLALGIVFGTLAIPFALDGRWTSAAWALEGAGIVWVGLRQRQTLAWAFGLLVQAGAWISFLFAMLDLNAAAALQANIWLGCLLLAAAALVMAFNFRRHGSHLYPELMTSLSVLFLTAATAWLLGGVWNEILLRTQATTLLNLLTLSALGVAALLAWLAKRENWHAPRALLLAVQVLAGLVLLSRSSWVWDAHPASLFDGSFLSALLLGAAAFASAWFAEQRARSGDAWVALVARPLLLWSGVLWFAAVLVPFTGWLLRLVDGDLSMQPYTGEHWLALYLIAVCATAPASAILARRLAWPQLRWVGVTAWIGLGLWSSNLLLALYVRGYLPTGLSWVALACALAAGEYLLLAWQKAGWGIDMRALRLLHTLRTAAPWLMLWPVGAMHISTWLARHEDSVSPAWARYLPAWAMMLALAWLIRRCRAGGWPVAPIANWYQSTLIPLGALWSLLLIAAWNVLDDGAMAPLPYLPLLNPLDLSTGFAVLLAVASYRLLPTGQVPLSALWQARLPVAAACFLYVWFNLMLLRTVSHYLGVPYTFDAMLASQFVQAMLSLVWSVTALLLMRHAAREQRRQQWSLGAVLLGLVVVKLFAIDLSNVGGIERIVSFVGVGLLMVLIGYLAPFPKTGAPAPAETAAGSRMKTTLILSIGLMAGAALAAPPQDRPQDYRWSIALTPQHGAGLNRISIPTDVYLHARSASLADVRLFDSTGKPLAFALTAAPTQSRTQRDTIAMRIFPVNGPTIGYYELNNVDIRTGNDGRLLSVTARGGSAPDAAPGLQALVLDAGPPARDSRISALRFTLPPGTDNYNAQVLLEVSDDLKQWDAIATTTLNWLRNSDTQTLANDRIEFAPRTFRYARLSWQYGEPITFAGIDAQQVSVTAIAAPRATIALKGTTGKSVDERLYATPIAIPADSIGLQLAQSNTSTPVTLGVYHQPSAAPRQRLHVRPQARTTQGANFEALLHTTFYRIDTDGKERVSGDLAMPVVQTAQWVLRPQYHSGTNPHLESVLRLGWTPASLVFLASGKGPYQLVFGKNGATPAALPLSQVAPGFTQAELLALPVATAARVVALTSDAPVEKTAAGAGLRLAALWGALLLGVAVLGFFAWRLLSQMKQEQGQE